MSSPCPAFAPGDFVSCYEILGHIASGGMSEVFEARDQFLHRVVALKAAKVESFAGSLLRKEGQALAAIRHPAVVTIYAMGVKDDIEYLVMERISGTTLEALLQEQPYHQPPFAIAQAVDILADVTAGLVAIHKAGVAHRDIKPENIMIASGGRVVLMDLGIFLAEVASPPEHVMGTPHYMAPESIRNRVRSGCMHLVDLYALGVLAFELLVGYPPFDGDDADDILRKHLQAPVPDLVALRPDIPIPLAQLVQELLAKDPAERSDSAETVLGRFRAIQKLLQAPPRARSVLVIDDDPDAASLLEVIIQRAVPGAQVVVAGEARTALAAIGRRRPDLILLDLEMPGLNGIELCMYLRGMESAAECPIVCVSARAQAGDLELLATLGVRHFVRKGYGLPERLSAAVRTIYAA